MRERGGEWWVSEENIKQKPKEVQGREVIFLGFSTLKFRSSTVSYFILYDVSYYTIHL